MKEECDHPIMHEDGYATCPVCGEGLGLPPVVICDCCGGSGRIYARHYSDGDGRECSKCNGKGSLDSPRSPTEQAQ